MKNTNMCSLHEELPKSAVWKTRVHFYSQTLNFKQHFQCQHNVLWRHKHIQCIAIATPSIKNLFYMSSKR